MKRRGDSRKTIEAPAGKIGVGENHKTPPSSQLI